MSEINLEIKKLRYTDELFFVLLKILILEEKLSDQELNYKFDLEEF